MSELIISIVSFVIALSIIVGVHEYGHYIVGRWSGIKAEVFSIGFGPKLWSRVDKRGTVWQIAALPLGGYVKFKGDENAASVGGEDGGRDTMLGAPLWARAATVAAGPIFNFLFSIFLIVLVAFAVGRTTYPLEVESLAIESVPQPFELNLKAGDEIVAINGVEARSQAELRAALQQDFQGANANYTVVRDGQERDVLSANPRLPLVMDVSLNSAAEASDIQPGDIITAINGTPIYSFDEIVEATKSGAGAAMDLTLWRGNEEITRNLAPKLQDLPAEGGGFEKRYLIGISSGVYFEGATDSPGLFEAIGGGFAFVWEIISTSFSAIGHMITGAISTCNLSSPVGIAEASGKMASTGFLSYVQFIAVISTAIGFLNILPIPVLDGGHLMFVAYEAITGKRPSDRAVYGMMAAGLTIILGLMFLGLANDLFLC